MVLNIKVYKKCSDSGKITLYMGKREFVDTIEAVEPIEGVVAVDPDYIKNGNKIYVDLICNFRYGREEDEVMGLKFQKDLKLVSQQIYPSVSLNEKEQQKNLSPLQQRLIKKLGSNVFPFSLILPTNAPATITLQQSNEETGDPCGVQYFVKVHAEEKTTTRSIPHSRITLGIRKVQQAPTSDGVQPNIVVRKDFVFSPGELELEVTLDKQFYRQGERIAVYLSIKNNSNKVVKKIRTMVQQGVDVVLFQNGQYKNTVASVETSEGCPIHPGSSVQRIIYLMPLLESNRGRRGIALEGSVTKGENFLASSTLITNEQQVNDAFGIIVSYAVKVKLLLGALGGELSAELPFILMDASPDYEAKILKGFGN